MKIATWNVNGIRARHAQFKDWIERDQPDVVCLQEIKAKPEQIPESICSLEGYTCYWHGAGGYSGVGLHVRRELITTDQPKYSHPEFDHETRIVEITLGEIVVASVYVPNGGKDYEAKKAFMHSLEGYARAKHATGKKLVLCGDINVARTDMDVHPRERKPGIIGQRPEERELLERILSAGLVDLGRAFDPDNESLFTWWAPWRNLRQRNIGWRLDYVLASEPLASTASGCPVLSEIGTSDHAPVMATFAL